MNAVLSSLLLLSAFDAPEKKGRPGEAVFDPARVHAVHLTVRPDQFAAMQRKGGLLGGLLPLPGSKPQWVKADLTMMGKEYKDVGLRHKGNFTLAASPGLKKSVKVDLDRHVPSRALDGLKMLNLNCGVTDPSQCREALSYAFFRAAGVPAPRTAYAELTLTVPGKYDREPVGVYTVVEQVDRGFLARHFGSGKGMLLKPEGLAGGIRHLGDDWKAYQGRYRPKSEPTEAQRKRLIDFARLVDRSDDATFRKEVGSYLDVDAFLSFLAANALLVNLDSYLSYGHNYYLYLVPKTGKFAFIPWDLDLSLAAWPFGGPPERQVGLSLMRPYTGSNRLIERLLADEAVKKRYRETLQRMADGPFAKGKLLAALGPLEKAVKGPIQREKKAVAARKEGGGGGFGPMPAGGFGASMPPRLFVEKRTESVAAQLAGKSEGVVVGGFGFGRP